MENLTETFASAYSNSSHLIQFHQITQSTTFAQSMLQKWADLQLWASGSKALLTAFSFLKDSIS